MFVLYRRRVVCGFPEDVRQRTQRNVYVGYRMKFAGLEIREIEIPATRNLNIVNFGVIRIVG